MASNDVITVKALEPDTYSGHDDDSGFAVCFDITRNLYNNILETRSTPRKMKMTHDILCCYVFGTFPEEIESTLLRQKQWTRDELDEKKEYITSLFKSGQLKNLGYHGNDVATTALIDIKILEERLFANKPVCIDFQSQYRGYQLCEMGTSERTLKRFWKKFPELVWFGDTPGGDLGASYYGFMNGVVDGLLVDIAFFDLDLNVESDDE